MSKPKYVSRTSLCVVCKNIYVERKNIYVVQKKYMRWGSDVTPEVIVWHRNVGSQASQLRLELKPAMADARWLPDTERSFLDINSAVSSAWQTPFTNAVASEPFDAVECHIWRLEDYETTLAILVSRTRESFLLEISRFWIIYKVSSGIIAESRNELETSADDLQREPIGVATVPGWYC